ncbi:riboflavin kinase [Patescibacteria group bacterium]|nr:riboflavin kinase [Patescibacteria group bacterium]
MDIITFTGNTIVGSGRGKKLGYPTINLNLKDIPSDLEKGIYAGWITINNQPSTVDCRERSVSRANPAKRDERVDCRKFSAAIHYGPRPVFDNTTSFEIHLIDHSADSIPETLDIQIIKRLRDVQNFPTEEALKEQIAMDIEEVRKILANE